MMPKSSLIVELNKMPVLGIRLDNISVLRLDMLGGSAPGNKWFKLQGNLKEAHKLGVKRIVSFGGAWSNHLHALAAIGAEQGLKTTGIVRGEEPEYPSSMLCDARDWGMELVYVSRTEYRSRNNADYLRRLQGRFANSLIIPEGGANRAGVEGCFAIADFLKNAGLGSADKIVLAVGTGTTLAGVVSGLDQHRGTGETGPEVVGFSVLKGALDLDDSVKQFTVDAGIRWQVLHDYHCGGYARASSELREFMLAFEKIQGVFLDPVYTGKAMFAVHQMIASGIWSKDQRIVLIHTGGLQGRRGFSWLP